MNSYQVYKNRATNLKVHKVTANNIFSLSSLTNDYEQLTDEMLETIEKYELLVTQLERLNSGKKKYYD